MIKFYLHFTQGGFGGALGVFAGFGALGLEGAFGFGAFFGGLGFGGGLGFCTSLLMEPGALQWVIAGATAVNIIKAMARIIVFMGSV